MARSCRRIDRWIQLDIEDRLDDKRRRQLQKHLAECVSCQKSYVEYSALEERLKASLTRVEVPEAFADEVMSSIRLAELRVAKDQAVGLKPRVKWIGGLVGVAAAAVLVWQVGLNDPVNMNPGGLTEVAENPGLVTQTPEIGGDTEETTEIDNLPVGGEEVSQPGEDEVDPGTVVSDQEVPEVGGEDKPRPPEEKTPTKEPTVPVKKNPDREGVLDVDLSDQHRLTDKMTLASQKTLASSGKVVVKPVYVDKKIDAIAPFYSADGTDIRFYAKAENDKSFSLVERTPEAYEVLSSDVASSASAIAKEEANIDRTGLKLKEGALYYGSQQIMPILEGASMDYALSPDKTVVVISVTSPKDDLTGLWVSDTNASELRKLTRAGGGRLLGWSANGSWVTYTEATGDVYVTNMQTDKTYLMASNADANGTAKVAYHPKKNQILIGGNIKGVESIYIADLP